MVRSQILIYCFWLLLRRLADAYTLCLQQVMPAQVCLAALLTTVVHTVRIAAQGTEGEHLKGALSAPSPPIRNTAEASSWRQAAAAW